MSVETGLEREGQGAAAWRGYPATAADTREVARRLGEVTPPGAVFALTGPLGAGKTTFAQGLLAGMGVRDPVTSPTFTLVHRYQGRVPVLHVDAYRLEPGFDPAELGLDDTGEDTVLVVEWADRAAPGLPADRLQVDMAYGDAPAAGRIITLTATGPLHRRLLREAGLAAGAGGEDEPC